jgi:heme exporter protein A
LLTSDASWIGDELVGENLSCRRGGRLIFTGLDVRLAAGGVLLLTGSNGSGKSSLLRLLATLIEPATGSLLWGAAAVADDAARYRMALHYVGHLDAAKPALTPRETLAFWSIMRGSAAPAVDGALAAFGLEAVADWPCRWLSAGQRRRLALARLVAAPAPVWLLDEPTAALDSQSEARLVATIAAHRAAGGRAVIATHQPIAIQDITTLALDDFAASPEEALAAAW